MPSATSSISVDTVPLPSGSQLSILRHDRQPRVCWLSAMEVHAHVLCTNLHTLPRNVQLSRKASYRQDLTKLNLPYRIATRDELNALKAAGVLSMQAPSSMLMRVEDALKLLKEKGKGKVRKEVKRKWRQWTAATTADTATHADTKRGKENRAENSGSGDAAAAASEQVRRKGDSENDRKKGGRRQRKRSMAVENSDTDQHKSDADDDSSSSSGEEDGLDDSGEDEGHHNTAARILSSHQFHLLWSTPISPPALPPTPTPTSSPATSPTNSPTPTPVAALSSTVPPPSPLPLLSPLARLKKRPRKSSSPFSLSWSRWLGEMEVSVEVLSDSDDEGETEGKRRRLLQHHRLKARSM